MEKNNKGGRELDWIACIVRYRERCWLDGLGDARVMQMRSTRRRSPGGVGGTSTNHKSKLELEKGGQGGISLASGRKKEERRAVK